MNCPLPEKARKRSDHPDTGTPLFRQHLGNVKRAGKDGVDAAWLDYDRFKSDIAADGAGTSYGDLRLTRINESKSRGPGNFTWMSRADIVARTHGKVFTAFGRTWPTKELALQEFGFPKNVFDHRMKAGSTIEEGLSAPLGETSKRSFSFDGETWDSRNKACIELAERHGVTPHKVKDRLIRGIGTAMWPAMNHARRAQVPLKTRY